MKSSFTDHELSLIAQFRAIVADILEDKYEETDDFLITWIRCAKYDLKKAEELLRNSKKWRKANDMDKILQEDMKEIAEEYPYETWGIDKDGCPILAMKCDRDFRKLINGPDGKAKMVRYMLRGCQQTLENIRKQHFKTNGRVSKFCGVIDMEGFTYTQLTSSKLISGITELARIAEENSPGVTKTLYIVNAPRMFKLLLNVVKPFLSEDTISRIKLINGSSAEIKKLLLENISPDQLPSFIKA